MGQDLITYGLGPKVGGCACVTVSLSLQCSTTLFVQWNDAHIWVLEVVIHMVIYF